MPYYSAGPRRACLTATPYRRQLIIHRVLWTTLLIACRDAPSPLPNNWNPLERSRNGRREVRPGLAKKSLLKQPLPCGAHGLIGSLLDPGLDLLQVCLIDVHGGPAEQILHVPPHLG
jgi:hypothetical protein